MDVKIESKTQKFEKHNPHRIKTFDGKLDDFSQILNESIVPHYFPNNSGLLGKQTCWNPLQHRRFPYPCLLFSSIATSSPPIRDVCFFERLRNTQYFFTEPIYYTYIVYLLVEYSFLLPSGIFLLQNVSLDL